MTVPFLYFERNRLLYKFCSLVDRVERRYSGEVDGSDLLIKMLTCVKTQEMGVCWDKQCVGT